MTDPADTWPIVSPEELRAEDEVEITARGRIICAAKDLFGVNFGDGVTYFGSEELAAMTIRRKPAPPPPVTVEEVMAALRKVAGGVVPRAEEMIEAQAVVARYDAERSHPKGPSRGREIDLENRRLDVATLNARIAKLERALQKIEAGPTEMSDYWHPFLRRGFENGAEWAANIAHKALSGES